MDLQLVVDGENSEYNSQHEECGRSTTNQEAFIASVIIAITVDKIYNQPNNGND